MVNPAGTYLAGKICTCSQYAADLDAICIGCASKHPDRICDPPPCRACGGWPPQFVERCQNCSQVFYAWFGYVFTPYENWKKYWCWACHEAYLPHNKLRPPPKCVLPDLDEILKGVFIEL